MIEWLGMGRDEKNIEAMYGAEDLGASPLFAGGFINFGLWKNIPAGRIGLRTRVESSRALYRAVWERLSIIKADAVVEVGCGRGLGASLLLKSLHPRQVLGLDFHPEQVSRARALNAAPIRGGRLSFLQGPAEALPLPDGCCSKLYSLEAAQHFRSVPKFLWEAARVLRPGGRIAVATFFASRPSAVRKLRRLLPTVERDIDRVIPIQGALRAFKAAGFVRMRSESLGPRVWEGWDRWLAQTEFAQGWGRNWLKAYRCDLLDYYLVSAGR